jgi:hypothetical protein
MVSPAELEEEIQGLSEQTRTLPSRRGVTFFARCFIWCAGADHGGALGEVVAPHTSAGSGQTG